jgi:hypothetical protein
MRIMVGVLLGSVLSLGASAQQAHPRDGEIRDGDTVGWWHTTEALSGDSMEGRDVGGAMYQKAAEYVAKRFEAAGLKPAGEGGGYFQSVPMYELAVDASGTSFTVQGPKGQVGLEFLAEITIAPIEGLPPQLEGPLTFRGYCGSDAMNDVAGKFVVCFGTQRKGLPGATERAALAREGRALGVINVDDPYFTIEPPRWPAAYARAVATGVRPEPSKQKAMPVMRLSAEGFKKLLAGSGKDSAAVLKVGGAQQPLASFEIPGKLEISVHMSRREYSSANVLAVLPGSDAKLGAEYVAVSAHLDGYGFGEAVKGDKLYNGTLDDAAYVALLIQMADDMHGGAPPKDGAPAPQGPPGLMLPVPKRSILFCVFTGEEKGLLGSNWYAAHPTVPMAQTVADVNLDQLRPLFPLKILTAEAVNDTTLGATAKQVGGKMGIEIREDHETERGLLRRADQYPFLHAGVPSISFIFGYDPGTEAEKKYREWYDVRYHRPQDDLMQPMDFDAAAKFDLFFYRLVETIADAPVRPSFLAGSTFLKDLKPAGHRQ